MIRPEFDDIEKMADTPSGNDAKVTEIEEKVEELIKAIQAHPVDTKRSRVYQQKIAEAFTNTVFPKKHLAPFATLHQNDDLSREELLDELEKVLSETEIDSRKSRSIIRQNAFRRVVIFLVSVLLIMTGFAMIIMPAPPSFEMFTIFYFNANDGVTIMDLVSLLIIFGGVFLFVLNFGKK
jgi:ElaB/YqjD/DUF883 family membrane-anchored ribosome-binding protein